MCLHFLFQVTCKNYEHYEECYAVCQPKCGILETCFAISCGGGCVCDSGYIRNGHDECILISECPPRGGHD